MRTKGRFAAEEWRHLANCRDVDVNLFFPEDGESSAMAEEICSACDVRNDCLDRALSEPALGIWGGRSEKQRVKIRTQRRTDRRKPERTS